MLTCNLYLYLLVIVSISVGVVGGVLYSARCCVFGFGLLCWIGLWCCVMGLWFGDCLGRAFGVVVSLVGLGIVDRLW